MAGASAEVRTGQLATSARQRATPARASAGGYSQRMPTCADPGRARQRATAASHPDTNCPRLLVGARVRRGLPRPIQHDSGGELTKWRTRARLRLLHRSFFLDGSAARGRARVRRRDRRISKIALKRPGKLHGERAPLPIPRDRLRVAEMCVEVRGASADVSSERTITHLTSVSEVRCLAREGPSAVRECVGFGGVRRCAARIIGD
jgi:hypothetical protein